MANNFTGNPIVLDTFTSAIDVAVSLGYPAGTPLFINWIEWQIPTTIGHTAVVTDKVSGIDIFSEKCVAANQSIIKYFYGARVEGLYTAISGVGSGNIVIMLA